MNTKICDLLFITFWNYREQFHFITNEGICETCFCGIIFHGLLILLISRFKKKIIRGCIWHSAKYGNKIVYLFIILSRKYIKLLLVWLKGNKKYSGICHHIIISITPLWVLIISRSCPFSIFSVLSFKPSDSYSSLLIIPLVFPLFNPESK